MAIATHCDCLIQIWHEETQNRDAEELKPLEKRKCYNEEMGIQRAIGCR